MFQPNASSPISAASKRTSGARHSRPVSSAMRITRSGATCARHCGHTPSASSAATDGPIKAVVRLSMRVGRRATSTVGTSKCASASAATSPAGPPPITAALVDREGAGCSAMASIYQQIVGWAKRSVPTLS